MKKALIYISLMFIGGILILNGCKKDKTAETIDSDTQTAQDNSLAEGTFNDVNNIASQAVDNGSYGHSQCAADSRRKCHC
ncbi:MAG: hypothetical protein NT126_05085 [Bacteroidetes bacterium]|nr:hypothetical protein [Bacteroidota bacterium]